MTTNSQSVEDTIVENNETVQEEVAVIPAIASEKVVKQDVPVEPVEASNVAPVSVKPVIEGLSPRNIPLTAQPKDEADEIKSYRDSIEIALIREVEFELVQSAGRGRGTQFVPSEDLERVVKTYLPKRGEFAILPIGRNSDKPSEGGLVGSIAVENNFGFRFLSAKHLTEVTCVLVNGVRLTGYVLKGDGKGSRRAFYFPKNIVERAILLPQKGTQLKLQVAKLIIG